jgi:dTDP-4-dehydrorhamnose reductase
VGILKVIVTGANGLIGEEIVTVFAEFHEVLALKGRKDINVINTNEIITLVKKEKPDLIIHCAGVRDLDDCERDVEHTLLINVLGTRNMVLGAREVDCPLVFTSSNSVYDGMEIKEYNVYDKTNPLSVYAYSKLKSEEVIMQLLDKFFILRLPMLFGLKGKRNENLIYDTWNKIKNSEKVYAATDQVDNPTYTKDIAEALLKVVKTNYYGIYNLCNKGIGSRYDLVTEIAKAKGLSTDNIVKITSAQKYAKRSKYNPMSTFVFNHTFGIELEDWKLAMKRCINEE